MKNITNFVEFENELQKIRANNGWVINIECCGLFIFTVYDKETGRQLASTGSTGLFSILEVLKMPFDKSPWV